MPGKSSKPTLVTVRVPNEILAVWRAEAEAAGIGVAAHIVTKSVAATPQFTLPITNTSPLRLGGLSNPLPEADRLTESEKPPQPAGA